MSADLAMIAAPKSSDCTHAHAEVHDLIATSNTLPGSSPRAKTAIRARRSKPTPANQPRRLANLRRTVAAAFQCHQEAMGMVYRLVFVTLTYSPNTEPREKDISKFIQHVR